MAVGCEGGLVSGDGKVSCGIRPIGCSTAAVILVRGLELKVVQHATWAGMTGDGWGAVGMQ